MGENYRRVAVDVRARRLTPHNGTDVLDWARSAPGGTGRCVTFGRREGWLTCETREGPVAVEPGDWLIVDELSEFDTCTSDVFERTYEAEA